MLKYIFATLLDERADDMAFFDERIEKGVIAQLEGIVDSRVRAHGLHRGDRGAREARRQKFEFPVKWGIDLQSRARALPHREARRRSPVIVMNYPKEIKAFYMRLNDDGKTVAAMDVLAPGIGEIIGGSQREERLDVLDRAHRRDAASTRSTTAGTATCAATAPCRTPASASASSARVAYATGIANIRDVIPFPRTPGNARY